MENKTPIIINDELNDAPNILNEIPKKEFTLKTKDNISYNLSILQGENELILVAKKLNDLKDLTYKTTCKLETFHAIDKYFKQYEDIKQIFSEYFGLLKEDEISMSFGFKSITVEFKFETKSKKDTLPFLLNEEGIKVEKFAANVCNEIEMIKKENLSSKKDIDQIKKEQIRCDENFFQLNENIEKKLKEQYEKLQSFIEKSNQRRKEEIQTIREKYQKEIDSLKKENKELSKKVEMCSKVMDADKQLNNNIIEIKSFDKLNKEINLPKETENKLNNLIDNMNGIINQFKHDILPLILFEEKSKIIRHEELDLIQNGITRNFNKRIIKYNLLFRASRDGFGAANFHAKCDGKDFTVVFVETLTGRRFGGFTDAKWDQNGGYKEGGNGFVFSLTNKEVYYNKDSRYNIYSDIHYGPIFGDKDFYISDNCNRNSNSADCSNMAYDAKDKLYAFANAQNFTVKDYEVFQIILK